MWISSSVCDTTLVFHNKLSYHQDMTRKTLLMYCCPGWSRSWYILFCFSVPEPDIAWLSWSRLVTPIYILLAYLQLLTIVVKNTTFDTLHTWPFISQLPVSFGYCVLLVNQVRNGKWSPFYFIWPDLENIEKWIPTK